MSRRRFVRCCLLCAAPCVTAVWLCHGIRVIQGEPKQLEGRRGSKATGKESGCTSCRSCMIMRPHNGQAITDFITPVHPARRKLQLHPLLNE